ncbi:GNAT family N-acetyltransferase [uncultured Paraglaciecola sp.]|uniref:GNAT family N-acetyltransferase n=1 Tax=uncultured Paraglaciecola sp. TaxID=1765024 RepID=UPI0030D82E06
MSSVTRDPNFIIRPANVADTALILRFIKELADYEKLLHEVVANEATLKESLFGETPHAKVIIGEYQGKPVSFALYFHNFSTFLGRPGIYLEDLYVQPQMRGKGLGKILLGYLASLAIELNCGRLEWWVLDWNKPAIDFYQSLGAQPMDEWTVNRVTGSALEKLAQQLK